MKVEIHCNGRISVELTAETPIEAVVLGQMIGDALKGKRVKIESAESTVEHPKAVVSVEA